MAKLRGGLIERCGGLKRTIPWLLLGAMSTGCTFGRVASRASERERGYATTQSAYDLAVKIGDREVREDLDTLFASRDHGPATTEVFECVFDYVLGASQTHQATQLRAGPEPENSLRAYTQNIKLRDHAKMAGHHARECMQRCDQALAKLDVEAPEYERDVALARKYRDQCENDEATAAAAVRAIVEGADRKQLEDLLARARSQASAGCFVGLANTLEVADAAAGDAQIDDFTREFASLREQQSQGLSRVDDYLADPKVVRTQAALKTHDATLKRIDLRIASLEKQLTSSSSSSAYNVQSGAASHSSGDPVVAEDLREQLDASWEQRRIVESTRAIDEGRLQGYQDAFEVGCPRDGRV